MLHPAPLRHLALLAALGLALLVLVAPSTASADSTIERIAWRTDAPDTVLADADASNRIVMVDVYATWCGPCHMLDRETFPDSRVVELSQKMLALKIDGETPPGEALMARYHVVAFPTVLFLNPDGTELDRIVGFVDADEFARIASGYLEGRGTLEDLENALARTPDDLELREDVFLRHVMRGNESQALAHASALREKLASYEPSGEGQKSRATRLASIDFALARYLYLRGKKDYATARRLLEGLQRDYPETRVAAQADYPLAQALIGLGDEDGGFALLQRLVDEDPKSAGTYNTVAWFCARERLRLPWGIEMARKGLELAPDDAGLWDTLAELHFLAGDTASAITAIEKAIALDANEPYFAQQLERFTAAR